MIIKIGNKKLLFIHIPKTGGTSVENYFTKYMNIHLQWPTFHKDILWGLGDNGLEYQHLTMKQVFSITDYSLNDFDGIFTIIREPIARFQSFCSWANKEPENIIHKINSNFYCHYLSQYDYIKDYEDYIKIYRFEDGINNIIKNIIINYNLQVPMDIVPCIYKSKEKKYISNNIKNILYKKLSKDFEYFKYKKSKIGITINLLSNKIQDIYGNGINQNIIFLYELLEKNGYDVYFISPINKNNIDYLDKIYNNIFFDNIVDLLCLNIYIQIGLTIDINYLKKLKNNSINCIKIFLGNDFVYNMSTILHNKKNGLNISKFNFHEIWISPQFEYSIDYYKYICKNNNVKVAPFIWKPTFLDEYTGTFDKNNISVGIFESNFAIQKSCFIPMIICDKAKEYIKKTFVFCSKQLTENKLFVEFANKSDLVKDGRMTFEGRHKFVPMMNKHCNIVVSFQQDVGLNYLLLECLHLGIPLIHNSPFFKEYGYYYEGYNTTSASKHIEDLYKNGFNREEYIEKNKEILYRYSPENPENINFFVNKLNNN